MQLWTICTCQYQAMHENRVKNDLILFEFPPNTILKMKTFRRKKGGNFQSIYVTLNFPTLELNFFVYRNFKWFSFVLYPIFVHTLKILSRRLHDLKKDEVKKNSTNTTQVSLRSTFNLLGLLWSMEYGRGNMRFFAI